jgi:hypothetical protein
MARQDKKFPILPFLGALLSDISFAWDGNTTWWCKGQNAMVGDEYPFHAVHPMEESIAQRSSMSLGPASVSEEELEISLPLRSHCRLPSGPPRMTVHWSKFQILYRLAHEFVQIVHELDDSLPPYYNRSSAKDIPSWFGPINVYFTHLCVHQDENMDQVLDRLSFLAEPEGTTI